MDQPTSRENSESMLRGGCAHGGNKTKEDVVERGLLQILIEFLNLSHFCHVIPLSMNDNYLKFTIITHIYHTALFQKIYLFGLFSLSPCPNSLNMTCTYSRSGSGPPKVMGHRL